MDPPTKEDLPNHLINRPSLFPHYYYCAINSFIRFPHSFSHHSRDPFSLSQEKYIRLKFETSTVVTPTFRIGNLRWTTVESVPAPVSPRLHSQISSDLIRPNLGPANGQLPSSSSLISRATRPSSFDPFAPVDTFRERPARRFDPDRSTADSQAADVEHPASAPSFDVRRDCFWRSARHRQGFLSSSPLRRSALGQVDDNPDRAISVQTVDV